MPRKKAPKEETIPHVITTEDLKANPQLAAEGVQVGEEVTLPAEDDGGANQVRDWPQNPAKSEFHVHNADGGLARTYSISVHGENAESLAKQYAGKIGGSVR